MQVMLPEQRKSAVRPQHLTNTTRASKDMERTQMKQPEMGARFARVNRRATALTALLLALAPMAATMSPS